MGAGKRPSSYSSRMQGIESNFIVFFSVKVKTTQKKSDCENYVRQNMYLKLTFKLTPNFYFLCCLWGGAGMGDTDRKRNHVLI